MKVQDLRKKTISELDEELVGLHKEQFGLRMQHGAGESSHTSLFPKGRKNIARVKTIINEKIRAGEK